MNSKDILLCGAHLGNNFGDTLLAFLFGREILSAGHRLHVPNANPELRRQLEQLGWNEQPLPKRFGAIVYHGGGYFGEPSRKVSRRWGKRMLKRYVFPQLKQLLTDCPYAILGVGAGPLSYFPARWAVKKMVQSAAVVSVRDEESRDYLMQYGVTRPVSVFPDVALAIGINHSFKRSGSRYVRTGLHLTSLPKINGSEDAFIDELRDAINANELEVVAFMDHEGMDGAQKRCEEIASRLAPVPCEVRPPYSDLFEMLGFIDSLDLLLTDKLHVGICAAAMGKRIVSLPKHQKTSRFYRQLGVPDWQLDRDALPSGAISSLIAEMVKTLGQPIPSVQKAIQASEGHIELLREFLQQL